MNILLNSKKTGFFCFIKHSGYGSPKTLCCLGNGKQGMDARLIHGCRVSIFLDTMCLYEARQGLTDVTVFIIYWMDSLVASFCYFANSLYCETLCLPIRYRVCLMFAVLTLAISRGFPILWFFFILDLSFYDFFWKEGRD